MGALALPGRAALLLALCAALAACGPGKETVVVYSPHGADVLKDYEARFEAAYPKVDVQWLDMGAKDVHGRLSAERARPACDVWWGAPSTMFTQAASEGLLAPYRPTWADAVDPEHKDPQDRWHATYLSPLAIMFNTSARTRDDVPHTWDELLDPKWDGLITLRKPLPSGTMRTFLCAMISRAPGVDAGIAWLKKLHTATESYPENPHLLYDHLKKEPGLISVWIQPDIVMQRDLHGYPFGFYLPPDTPVITDGIAIVNNAPHPEWARKFYEFVTREEELLHQAAAYAKLPARTDIDRDALPAWMTEMAIDPMPIDWAAFARHEREWCARWEREVYQ